MSSYVPTKLRKNPYITIQEDVFFEDDVFNESYYRLEKEGQAQTTTAVGLPKDSNQPTGTDSRRRLLVERSGTKLMMTWKKRIRRYKLSIIALTIALLVVLGGCLICIAVIFDLKKTNALLANMCASSK